ncbi:MAG TPA: SigE family RNA polymerase sigma factor [Pseudonocardiaceae bacterium]|jgi:RNA polymerase sigma-70 factor (sigma-E family)|nr:SigE family RNA polymerase sigma factor [Pseudonocardiaceae bacterium]
MRTDEEARFREFATEQAAALRRCAFLFCGDWHLAEDLMQSALIKIYRAWTRIDRQEATAKYARKVLLRTWLDEKRRPWRRSEVRAEVLPDVRDSALGPDELAARLSTRDLVHRALLALAPRQRAVLVLRYFDELSIAETAEAMGCSEGTVKSQAARGLDNLRQALARLESVEFGSPARRSAPDPGPAAVRGTVVS